jgi:hypothetical protein
MCGFCSINVSMNQQSSFAACLTVKLASHCAEEQGQATYHHRTTKRRARDQNRKD